MSQLVVPGEAHWQIGFLERRHYTWELMVRKARMVGKYMLYSTSYLFHMAVAVYNELPLVALENRGPFLVQHAKLPITHKKLLEDSSVYHTPSDEVELRG